MRELSHRDHGIDQNHQVGPGTDSFDRIGSVGLAELEVRADCRRDVTAGGESKDADTLRIDVPFTRPRTHCANRARRILQRGRMMVSRSEPILEHERSNAQLIKPFRDWLPFVIG